MCVFPWRFLDTIPRDQIPEPEPSCVSVWIDGSQYAVVDCPMIPGGVEFVMTDTRVSLYNLRVE